MWPLAPVRKSKSGAEEKIRSPRETSLAPSVAVIVSHSFSVSRRGCRPKWGMARFFRRELGKPKARCGAQGTPPLRGWLTFPSKRADGAPSGATFFYRAAPLLRGMRAPLGAPPGLAYALPGLFGGDFCPRGHSSGRGRSPSGPPIRQVFARLRPRHVQPFKAVPRSGDGRRAGASRVRGYEPRPRAPPLLPFQQRPAGTPLMEKGRGI